MRKPRPKRKCKASSKPNVRLLRRQDTFYVGTLKGVGRVYQQTFIDTYAKIGFAKLYDRKTPITAADLLNDRVLPFYEENGSSYSVFSPTGARILRQSRASRIRALSRRREYRPHPNQGQEPQTNGIVERYHKTMLNESMHRFARRSMRRSANAEGSEMDDGVANPIVVGAD